MDIEIKEEPIDQGVTFDSKDPLFDSSKAGAKFSDPLLEIEVKRGAIREPTKKTVKKTKNGNKKTKSKPKEKEADSDKQIHQCPICNEIKATSQSLKTHQLVHTVERKFKCLKCPNSFKTELALKKHSALVHEGLKQFTCEICAKSFGRADYLEKHLLTHSENRNFICEICNDAFKMSDTLNNHRRTVHNIEPERHCCHVCGKVFTTAFYLREHLERHQDVRRFKCEFCEKRFNSNSNLQQHRSIHLNERKFQCHLCEKAFNLRITLNQHLRRHKDYQPEEVGEKRKGRKVGGTKNQKSVVSKIGVNDEMSPEEVSGKRRGRKVGGTKNQRAVVPKIGVNDEINPDNSQDDPATSSKENDQEHLQPDGQEEIQVTVTIEEKPALTVPEIDPIANDLKQEETDLNFEIPDFAFENLDESGIQNIFIPTDNTNLMIDELEEGLGDLEDGQKLKDSVKDGEAGGTDANKKRSCHICGKKFKLLFHLRGHLDRHQDVRRQIEALIKKELNIDVSKLAKNIGNIKVEKEENDLFENFEVKQEFEDDQQPSTSGRSEELPATKKPHKNGQKSIENKNEQDEQSTTTTRNVKSNQNAKKEKKCLECGKIFKFNQTLKFHASVHKTSRDVPCSKCTMKFKDHRGMERHYKYQHIENCKTYECDFCGKFFKRRSLKNHFAVHSNLKPFICESCGDTFKTATSLSSHVKHMHRERKHSCKNCGNAFVGTTYLREHRCRGASKREKNFKCTICEKAFSVKAVLNKHLIRVHNETPIASKSKRIGHGRLKKGGTKKPKVGKSDGAV